MSGVKGRTTSDEVLRSNSGAAKEFSALEEKNSNFVVKKSFTKFVVNKLSFQKINYNKNTQLVVVTKQTLVFLKTLLNVKRVLGFFEIFCLKYFPYC